MRSPRWLRPVNTLDGFIREMKGRFPEVASRQPLPDEPKVDPNPTGSLPQIKGLRPAAKRITL